MEGAPCRSIRLCRRLARALHFTLARLPGHGPVRGAKGLADICNGEKLDASFHPVGGKLSSANELLRSLGPLDVSGQTAGHDLRLLGNP